MVLFYVNDYVKFYINKFSKPYNFNKFIALLESRGIARHCKFISHFSVLDIKK